MTQQAQSEKKIQYYDAGGSVRTDLLSAYAEIVGKQLAEEKSIKFKSKGYFKITPTQLRRFFDDVKAMQRYIDQFQGNERENAFKRKLPEIMMMRAKVSYARGRDTVTDGFLSFINENMNSVKTAKDFDVFCKFFEAVYGFFSFHSASAAANEQSQYSRR